MRTLVKYFDALPAPAGKSKPIITLLLLLIATGATYIPGAFELTVFDHSAVRQGEWWRLVTGHFTHTGSSHLMWDLIAAAFAIGYLESRSRRLAITAIVSGILTVDLLLLSPFSSLQFYCGLSGLLFAPLTLSVTIFGLKNDGLTGWLPALICLSKVIWELICSDSFLVTSSWQAYPMAHLAGLSGGILAVSWLIGHQQLLSVLAMVKFELTTQERAF